MSSENPATIAGNGRRATRRRPMTRYLRQPFIGNSSLRGGAVLRPHRLIFLAVQLDQIGRGQRVLPGVVELDAADSRSSADPA